MREREICTCGVVCVSSVPTVACDDQTLNHEMHILARETLTGMICRILKAPQLKLA